MWGSSGKVEVQDIVGMLNTIRAGNGATEQISKHSKRIFALLGAANNKEVLALLREATENFPRDKHVAAAENALNLDGSPSNLTGRRNKSIQAAQREEQRQRDSGVRLRGPAYPTTASGVKLWEDQGFQKMATFLHQRMPSSDLYLAVGKLNARVYALESELQKEKQLAQYRDDRIKSALFETAAIITSILNNRDHLEPAIEAALIRLSALQRLYLGQAGYVRPLDLSGHPASGLFEESLKTQLLDVVERRANKSTQDETQDPINI